MTAQTYLNSIHPAHGKDIIEVLREFIKTIEEGSVVITQWSHENETEESPLPFSYRVHRIPTGRFTITMHCRRVQQQGPEEYFVNNLEMMSKEEFEKEPEEDYKWDEY